MDVYAQRTSPFNFVDPVRAEASALGEVHICDVTLRDGEQAPDAAFTPEDKVEVAALLDEIGVHQIQAGHARHDVRTVRLLKQTGIKAPTELLVTGFIPTWKAEIDAALESEVVHIVVRSSDRQLGFLGLTRGDALDRTAATVEYACSQGAKMVLFAPSHSTMADLGFLKELVGTAVRAGARRVNIPDSVGTARPAVIKFLARELTAAFDVEVGVHCHNDFGLATACTLAGLEGGATWADVSVNGLGERAGNSSIDEVVLALRCLYGVDVGLKTERLYELSRLVSRLLRKPVPRNKPIVGDNNFAQKLDVHVAVTSKHPESFEPFDPAWVGNRRWVRLGKGSGQNAVRAKLEELGLSADDDQVKRLVAWVNETAETTKDFVDDEAVARFLTGAVQQ